MWVHRAWCPLYAQSQLKKSQSFGTTLSTLILVFAISHTSLLPPLSVSIFATVAARASQLVHKRRQSAYEVVHALMCLMLLHAQSQLKKITIIRDDVVDPGPFLHHSPHITFSMIEAFLAHAHPFVHRRRQNAYRAVHILMCSLLPGAVNHSKKTSSGTILSTLILGCSRSHFPGSRATPRHSVLPRSIRSRITNTFFEKCCFSNLFHHGGSGRGSIDVAPVHPKHVLRKMLFF